MTGAGSKVWHWFVALTLVALGVFAVAIADRDDKARASAVHHKPVGSDGMCDEGWWIVAITRDGGLVCEVKGPIP